MNQIGDLDDLLGGSVPPTSSIEQPKNALDFFNDNNSAFNTQPV